MKTPEDLKRDLTEILGKGITHTGTVIELLEGRGYSSNEILPVIWQLLMGGSVDPTGTKTAYKEN